MFKEKSADRSPRSSKSILLSLGSVLCLCAPGALGQVVPRLIDPSAQFPHAVTQQNDAGTVANGAPATTSVQTTGPAAGFVLNQVVVRGANAIDKGRLDALWQPLHGKTVTVQDIVQVGNRIADLYAQDGYELVSVQIPAQQFVAGNVAIDVIEGHVAAITIAGNTADGDLTLIKNYAAKIIADSPLRRATLERYILLMNDIPGLKVGSEFEAIEGQPGSVRLKLTILQRQFDWGFQVNNLGISALGNTQATLVGAVDNLFQQGDQTQLTFGFPFEFNRYQYIGLSQREPLGLNGAYFQIGAGYLRTDPNNLSLNGEANTVSATVNYPLIRSLHENLILSGGADMLNSSSALLGRALADERTRNLRLSAAYSFDDSWKGSNLASMSFGQGLDVLGARRGNIAFGGPTYTKLGFLLSRDQQLPLSLILRTKLQAQYSPDHLPNSEQFLFGGPYFGRAFDTAFLSGDDGVAASIELAHPTPESWTPDYLTGSEAFGFVDWGEASNVNAIYQLPYARASSAGAGLRLKVMQKATVELSGAMVVAQPTQYARVESPRFVMNITRLF